jgi:hypothetical protein
MFTEEGIFVIMPSSGPRGYKTKFPSGPLTTRTGHVNPLTLGHSAGCTLGPRGEDPERWDTQKHALHSEAPEHNFGRKAAECANLLASLLRVMALHFWPG